MKITYTLKAEDLMVFYKRLLQRRSFVFKKYIFVIVALLALLIGFYNRQSYSISEQNRSELSSVIYTYWLDVIISFIFLSLAVWIIRLITFSLIRNQIRKQSGYFGEKTLELSDNAIVFASTNSRTEYPITTIKEIEVFNGYYFLYLNKQSAIIVPIKTLGSDEFIKLLYQKMKL